MKILKQGLLLVITFFVFLGLTACSLEREETYEKKFKDSIVRVTIRHRSNQMISEEFWADNFNVHIEDDSEFEYIKKRLLIPKRNFGLYNRCESYERGWADDSYQNRLPRPRC